MGHSFLSVPQFLLRLPVFNIPRSAAHLSRIARHRREIVAIGQTGLARSSRERRLFAGSICVRGARNTASSGRNYVETSRATRSRTPDGAKYSPEDGTCRFGLLKFPGWEDVCCAFQSRMKNGDAIKAMGTNTEE